VTRVLFAAVALATACAGGGGTVESTSVGARSLAPCPSRPNCVSTLAEDAAHRVEPLALRVPAAQGWARCAMRWPRCRARMIVATGDGYLRAETTSRLFRFVDDLEALPPGRRARIDVRSASRVGYSDAGVNRARRSAARGLRRDGVVE
jgi:uncharacterized protein (DUF1499 family)